MLEIIELLVIAAAIRMAVTMGILYLLQFAQETEICEKLVLVWWIAMVVLLLGCALYCSVISAEIANMSLGIITGIIIIGAAILGAFIIYDSQKINYTAIKA